VAGLGVAADVGFAALLIPLAGAPTAGAVGNDAEVDPGDQLSASTNQLFDAFSTNITNNLTVIDGGVNQVYGDYLDALPSVSSTAAFMGMVEVSTELLTQQRTTSPTEIAGLIDVLAARPDLSNMPVAEPDLGDELSAVTNLYEGFSSNVADIVTATDAAVVQAHGDYLDALPSVSNIAAFIGLVETSDELLSAQGQANFTDVGGFTAALATHLDLNNPSNAPAAALDLSDVQGALTNQFEVLSANLNDNWTITEDAFGELGANPAMSLEASYELLESLFQGDLADTIGFTGVLATDLGLVLGAAF
jgi:hypothetical protein